MSTLLHAGNSVAEVVVSSRRNWMAAIVESPWPARISLCLVYYWFGVLKVLGRSPAAELVEQLRAVTLPWFPSAEFLVVLGLFEVALGVLFLVPRCARLTSVLFAGHMVATFLPLALLPDACWQAPFVPTLVGQYILKNVCFLALVAPLALRTPASAHRDSDG